MHNGHNRGCAVTSDERRWHHQRGIEGIEVPLITGLVVVIILATIPLASGGVQTVISSLAEELTNAGNASNRLTSP